MNRYQPALLGGLFIGVLSALPVINFLNCCCLWVILGGMLTVYLEQQNLPTPIETASAAMSGLIAGAIGGVINVLASMALMRATGGAQQEALEQALQNIPNVSPEIMDMVRSLLSGPSLPLVLFAITVPLYAVFGLLGALLGTAFFRKKPGPEGTGGAAS